jgi:pyruvate formate lyase activating enzyme
VAVTAGYVCAEPRAEFYAHMDAVNVDLKSFRDAFYREICGARLEPVLDALRLYRSLGVWLEVTTLVIPGENDSAEELRELAAFIRDELGEEVPWHVSAFHPDYRLTGRPRTGVDLLRRARGIGLEEGLRHVYVGNVPGESEHTICPGCSRVLIERRGFTVGRNHLAAGACPSCGTAVAGIWE